MAAVEVEHVGVAVPGGAPHRVVEGQERMWPKTAALVELDGARVGGQHVQVDRLAGVRRPFRGGQVREQAVQQQGCYAVAAALAHLRRSGDDGPRAKRMDRELFCSHPVLREQRAMHVSSTCSAQRPKWVELAPSYERFRERSGHVASRRRRTVHCLCFLRYTAPYALSR